MGCEVTQLQYDSIMFVSDTVKVWKQGKVTEYKVVKQKKCAISNTILMTFTLCHIKGEPQTLIKIVVCTMHDVGIGLLWAQVTRVKVANDTFKVMK